MREELQITVKTDQRTHKVDLNKDLSIDKSKLNDELSGQPASYAWYATLHELFRNKVLSLKNELELLESQLDQKLRANWDEASWGKRTEDGLRARIKLNKEYQTKMEGYIEAQKNQGILGVAKSAFEQKKDMLISIAANMRGESDLELRVNKDKVKSQLEKLRKG
jgi:hypothetical protein